MILPRERARESERERDCVRERGREGEREKGQCMWYEIERDVISVWQLGLKDHGQPEDEIIFY